MDLFAAADGFRGRLLRPDFQYARAAHGARDGNERLQRLSRFKKERQQRVDGATAFAGHELRQFHGTLRVCRVGRRARSGRRY